MGATRAAMSAQIPSLLLDHIYTHVYSLRQNGVRMLIHLNPSVLSYFYSETALTAVTHLNSPLL